MSNAFVAYLKSTSISHTMTMAALGVAINVVTALFRAHASIHRRRFLGHINSKLKRQNSKNCRSG